MLRESFILSLLLAAASPGGTGARTVGDVCADAVDSALSQTNGQLLSVRLHKDQCRLTVLIRQPGERPTRKVIEIQIRELEPVEARPPR
ncbi:hypothetical protein [Sinorhizobium alkalisoli]|uniref:hypothetical protein n=1 Tax=Sinorhizobium alkalisoli TaxID=1752398 RepID=UPI00124E682A|nr:hypothetical protein [Sinorhizobium alkalisoli]